MTDEGCDKPDPVCDPHVFISCEGDESGPKAPYSDNKFECSELLKCYAHFANNKSTPTDAAPTNDGVCDIKYTGTVKAISGATIVDDVNFVEGIDYQNEDDGVWFEHEDAECSLVNGEVVCS